MKSNAQFNKEVFEKYEHYKKDKNDKFFNSSLYRKKIPTTLKIVSTIMILLLTAVSVYAIVTTYNNNNTKLNPTYTEKIEDTDMNNIWVGTFQLVWNEFMDQRIKGNVVFEEGKSNLVNELNKRSFTKDMLSSQDYYIKVAPTEPKLKSEILKDISNNFDMKNSAVLDSIDFSSDNKSESYTLYSMLFKEFTFAKPFDKLKNQEPFANSEKKVQYFGINNASSEELNNNVEVLFYNGEADFAVKLKTKEEEDLLIYRTNNENSFNELYNQIIEKTNKYIGSKEFQKDDELKIPYINIDALISYNDLCEKTIKGTGGLYIQNAVQDVNFSLNEKGGNLISEASLKDMYKSFNDNSKLFYFTDSFVLFLKESEKTEAYFALRVNNTDVLITK